MCEAIIPGLLDGSVVPEEGWGKLGPSGKRGLPSDILVARTVVDLCKPRLAVRVLHLSDNERVIRKGTDVASCEVITLTEKPISEENNECRDLHGKVK